MPTLTPILSSTPGSPVTYNPGMAETFSWVPIENDAGRPLFARAGYITNLNDISISVDASNINVGSVELKDGASSLKADIDSVNGFNSLRVATQSIQPDTDTISLADVLGNNVTVTPLTSSLNVNVTNPISDISVSYKNSPQTDAFGRLRVSSPHTLFDSSHRFGDNQLWSTKTALGGTVDFISNEGVVALTTNGTQGSTVTRETTKVFSYQPGKSLLVMNTFVFAPAATGLRQRIGYSRDATNGFLLQLNNNVVSFIRYSRSLGNINPSDTSTTVNQTSWNVDPLNGTGPSRQTLDLTKVQILWMDFEWLGAGTVRCGFVIDGEFIVCHKFHHANGVNTSYMTTACLPLLYEIRNTGNTGTTHTLKQICSTVLSEGGYELRGAQSSVETNILTPKVLTSKGVYYPIITLRLNPTREDAIVILSNLSVLGISNGATYNWKLIGRAITTGGSGVWVDADTSSVQYKLDATSYNNGKVLTSGFIIGSNQGSTPINIPKEDLFKFQLERDVLNGNMYEITLVAASDTNGAEVFAAIDWEEITR
jgi:hypothetical protein